MTTEHVDGDQRPGTTIQPHPGGQEEEEEVVVPLASSMDGGSKRNVFLPSIISYDPIWPPSYQRLSPPPLPLP